LFSSLKSLIMLHHYKSFFIKKDKIKINFISQIEAQAI